MINVKYNKMRYKCTMHKVVETTYHDNKNYHNKIRFFHLHLKFISVE